MRPWSSFAFASVSITGKYTLNACAVQEGTFWKLPLLPFIVRMPYCEEFWGPCAGVPQCSWGKWQGEVSLCSEELISTRSPGVLREALTKNALGLICHVCVFSFFPNGIYIYIYI